MTHPETGEFYIGRRTSNIEPIKDIQYRGSSVKWYNSLNDEVIDTLIKDILEDSIKTSEDLNVAEIKWITENIKNPLCKNAHIPGKGFYTPGSLSVEQKDKMRISSTGKFHTEETKRKISESRKGTKWTLEQKEKLSESRKGKIGRPLSEETKKKLSKLNIGKTHSDETKIKISNKMKGIKRNPMSEETKRKISETKRKMSESKIQK